jgi:hypothetical protein
MSGAIIPIHEILGEKIYTPFQGIFFFPVNHMNVETRATCATARGRK